MTLLSRALAQKAEREAEKRDRDEARKAVNFGVLSIPSRSIGKGVYTGSTAGAAPKEPEPVRDESYRRWVASLPCFECGIEGYSNAAHPNSGKAKGVKLSDMECFPLCVDRPGIKGCHAKFDQYEIVERWAMPAYEQAALEWTRQQLGATT